MAYDQRGAYGDAWDRQRTSSDLAAARVRNRQDAAIPFPSNMVGNHVGQNIQLHGAHSPDSLPGHAEGIHPLRDFAEGALVGYVGIKLISTAFSRIVRR